MLGLILQTRVKHNRTLINQTQFRFFKSTLKLGFYTKPRFKFFVIPACMFQNLVRISTGQDSSSRN